MGWGEISPGLCSHCKKSSLRVKKQMIKEECLTEPAPAHLGHPRGPGIRSLNPSLWPTKPPTQDTAPAHLSQLISSPSSSILYLNPPLLAPSEGPVSIGPVQGPLGSHMQGWKEINE